jgi:hypothetical protein
MLTAEERVAIVSAQLCGLSYKQEQEWQEFMQKFRKPSLRANIRTLTTKFCGKGWVTGEEHSDRPPRTENSVKHIQHVVICMFVVISKGVTVKYGLKGNEMEPTNGTGTHHKCRYNYVSHRKKYMVPSRMHKVQFVETSTLTRYNSLWKHN